MTISRAFRADSSRTSSAAAGWANRGPAGGEYVEKGRDATFPRRFSWLRPRVLLESRNHALADLVRQANTDIVNDERMRWVAARRAAGVDTGFVIDLRGLGPTFSFLAVGDPGEGDVSQYVVVPHLLAQPHTSFALVVSDVIYPTGESNDYVDAFYRPYQAYPHPIYALPGNHDWYSLLTGFMWNVCGAEPLSEPTERLASYSWQERLARFLWLRPRSPERELLMAYRDERWRAGRPAGAAPEPHQAGPYFALRTESLWIICIDTGTSGTLDREQGQWLLDVAAEDGPKILFTGRPLWVNGEHRPYEIKWLPEFSQDEHPERTGDPAPVQTGDEPPPPEYQTVDDIVCDADFEFVAAVGGDVHNYQRYPVQVANGGAAHVVQYVVSGGGGAFMSPTHTIDNLDRVDDAPIDEADFRCYPLRGDSLARFAQGATRRLRRAVAIVFGVTAALWWLALQVWNPHNEKLQEVEFLWIPFSEIVRALNVSPGTEVWGVAPMSWLPADADYDEWSTIVLGGLALAAGGGLLALPWFRWRVKAVAALVAGGAALLTWDGSLIGLPGGSGTFAAVALVGALSIPLLSRQRARELRGLVRAPLIIALAVFAAVLADARPEGSARWDFVTAVSGLAALALLLVGGPRMDLRTSAYAGGAVGLLTAALYGVTAGWSWFPLALVAAGLTLFLLHAAGVLIWVLVAGGDVDPDQAGSYMSEVIQAPVKRAAGGEPGEVDFVARRKLKGLFLRPGRRSFLYPGETAYSALFDYNDQPFFKSFLRIDVDDGELKLYCFGVAEENEPVTVEDHARWTTTNGWTRARAVLGPIEGIGVIGEVDWYDGPQLAFDLGDNEVGNAFRVFFSANGAEWQNVGVLNYQERYGPFTPDADWPVAWPSWVGLSVGDAGVAPTFARGRFV